MLIADTSVMVYRNEHLRNNACLRLGMECANYGKKEKEDMVLCYMV